MTDGNRPPTVSEVGYKLSLMRVAPGKEEDVARQLSAAIKTHTLKKPIKILKLFGRFDLCAIYKTSDFNPGPSKGGPILGIRGANKILAFNWVTNAKSKNLAVESGRGSVWAISFFRFNESLLRQDGARVETALASHWLNNPIPGVTMAVLGTTGWAEVVLVLRSNKFAAIADALDAISKQKVYVLERSRTRIELVPAKTLSIFGIDYELVSSADRIRSLPTRLREPFAADKGVFPKLAVTCPAGSMWKVREYGEKYFGPCAKAFGVTDLVFEPENGTWGGLIGKVLRMRHSLARHIYSTSIGVFQEPPREQDSLLGGSTGGGVPKISRQGPLPFPRGLPALLKRSGPDLEGRLTNLYFGLINLMHDPVIGTCFADLRPFATKRLPLLLEKFTPGDDYWQNLLDSVVDVFQYGVEERAHGAFLSLEQLEGSLSPTKAGIQRVLAAAALIPKTLFSRIHRPWQGFLVAGYCNEFFSSHYDIINLPFKYLFHPQEWFGVFHETGHVAIFDTNFFNMDSAKITTTLRRGLHSAPEEEYELWRELVFEVGADLFDLYFCYGEAFNDYLSNIWPFLIRARGSLSQQYFVRSFIAYEYCKHFISARCRRFPTALALREEIADFRRTLGGLNLLQDIPGRSRRQADDAAIFGFGVLAPIVELYHHLFRKQGPAKDLARTLASPALRAQVAMVLRGGVITQRISSPDSFLLALKRHQSEKGEELALSVRLATILSLWHSAAKFSE